MNIFCLALVAAVVTTCVHAVPQIIPLCNYSNETTPSTILTLEAGANLYLASNDDSSLLQQIQINSGSSTLNLDQLLTMPYMSVADNLVIKSSIDPATAAQLTGYLYVTTTSQANDNTFFVTVVNGPTNLSRNDGKSTTVILNTQTSSANAPFDNPDKTTYVTNIQQANEINLNFHYGVPEENWNTATTNQFFENPQYIPNYYDNLTEADPTRAFFTNIEPLQINLPYWYITSNGKYSMALDSKYMNVHVQNPQTETVTGLVMITDAFQPQTVNFKVDPTKNGTTGILMSTFLDDRVNLYLVKSDGMSSQSYDSTTTIKHGQFVSDFAATQLFINSTSVKPGSFYCQYFVISGISMFTVPPTTPPAPTTQPAVPSTSTIVTTTKSSRSLKTIMSSLMFLVYILYSQ